MKKELDTFKRLNTWKLVDLPEGARTIGVKWVLRKKLEPDGTVGRYKARLVAQGYTQQKGIDFHETFAPVARMTSMRTILALAAHLGLQLEQIDVKSAYLHGKIDTEIYLRQPPGFEDLTHPDKVFLLDGNLYGLKQAAKIWNDNIDDAITSNGLHQVSVDPCIYVKLSNEGILIAELYVDDFLLGGTPYLVREFKEHLRKHFPIKELGFPKVIVGIQVEQQKGEVTLHQSAYLKRLVEDTGMSEANHVHTPIVVPRIPDSNSPLLTPDEKKDYQTILGRIMYATVATRPDLAFATGYLGRYSAASTQENWMMIKRLLRYINGRKENGITYHQGKGTLLLEEHVDADWGGSEDRKSTTGYLFTLNGAPISWMSKKQQTVALSSTEAEYIALTQATKEAIWFRAFLKDLGQEQKGPTIIYEDNKSAIALATNPINHQRTKHIDVQHHFVREKIKSREIEVKHTSTGEQLADAMTKGLGRNLFSNFSSKITTPIHQSSV